MQDLLWNRRGIAATATLLLFAVAAIYVWASASRYWASMSEYAGVRIASPRAEVMYALGYPKYVVQADRDPGALSNRIFYTDDSFGPQNRLPEGKGPNDFDTWGYALPSGGDLTVTFLGTTPSIFAIICTAVEPYRSGVCPAVQGVHIGDTEEEVLEELGTPTEERLHGVAKEMSYHESGPWVWLTKRRVYRVGLLERKASRWGEVKAFLRTLF
jgi:hypothetical protein